MWHRLYLSRLPPPRNNATSATTPVGIRLLASNRRRRQYGFFPPPSTPSNTAETHADHRGVCRAQRSSFSWQFAAGDFFFSPTAIWISSPKSHSGAVVSSADVKPHRVPGKVFRSFTAVFRTDSTRCLRRYFTRMTYLHDGGPRRAACGSNEHAVIECFRKSIRRPLASKALLYLPVGIRSPFRLCRHVLNVNK